MERCVCTLLMSQLDQMEDIIYSTCLISFRLYQLQFVIHQQENMNF